MEIQEHSIFRALSAERQDELLRAARMLRFRKGDLIYPPGGDFGRVYLLGEGEAMIGTYSPSGTRRMVLMVVTAGDLFGDLSFAQGLAANEGDTFAESLTDTRAYCVSTPVFAQCVREEKEALVTLLAYLTRRLYRSESKLSELAFCGVGERLVRELVRWGKEVGQVSKGTLVIGKAVTHEQLAAMVGASREAVTEALHDLAKKGLVTASRRGLVIAERLSETLN